MRTLPLLVSLLILSTTCMRTLAQRDESKIDSIRVKSMQGKQWIRATRVPLILALTGLYSTTDNDFFEKREIREERNENMPTFRHHIDDYLQYSPIGAVYGLNMIGIKGKNNLGDRKALLIKSELLMATLTFSLKKLTAVPRPDTGTPNSFPSGHTAQAFAAATFMHKEYGKQNIAYSIGAYSMATTIGVFRVMNNRHWVSDVLVGAAIGIVSTNIVYLTHQYHWRKKEKIHRSIIIPSYDGRSGSLNFVYSL